MSCVGCEVNQSYSSESAVAAVDLTGSRDLNSGSINGLIYLYNNLLGIKVKAVHTLKETKANKITGCIYCHIVRNPIEKFLLCINLV